MTDGDAQSRSAYGLSGAWVTAVAGACGVTALALSSGVTGLVYAVVYAVAVAPGIILGRRLVGARHPAGWIVGGVLGYGITQLALWVPIASHQPYGAAFVLAWLIESVVLGAIALRIKAPILALPSVSSGDARAFALTLLLVPVLMGAPYRNLGAEGPDGARYYRAYFTADFVWHTALAAELGRYETPPRNPYMASEKMHYYWAYFLLPSVVAHEAPAPLNDVQRVLKANAMLSAALLIGMLYWLVRSAVPSAVAAAAAVALAVLAQSAEGTYMLEKLWRTGRPLASVTNLNIDAITDWEFGGLRIDGLVRALWYNPQHSFACALGLVAGLIAATRSLAVSRGTVWVAGLALGLSTCFNPFVGGVFSVIYGLAVAFDAVRRPEAWRALLHAAKAAVPVGLALLWSLYNGVADDAGATVVVGFQGKARHDTIAVLMLSVGPVLLPALVGLWPWRALPTQPAVVAFIGVTVSLLIMHLLVLGETSWVGFRTGQILLLLLPVLLARLLWVLSRHRVWPAVLLGAVMLVIGLPTTVIDTYNAQDIGNQSAGPGFRWTLSISPAQQQLFAWIDTHVPEGAVVQMEPMLRGREHWSLIPTFAERRMAAGLAIPLVGMPKFEAASLRVQKVYTSLDVREAWQLARALDIDYIYLDAVDRAAHPDGSRKFDADPALFDKVYENRDVALYAVR